MTTELEKEIRLAIAKKGGQKQVAFEMGISESEFSRKINGSRGWTMEEWKKFFDVIGLKVSHIEDQDDSTLIKLMAKKLAVLIE